MFEEFVPYKINGKDIILNIKVSPGTSKTAFGKIEKQIEHGQEYNCLKVFLSAKAHDGEANKALIKFLADYLDIAKSNIKIISGLTSRIKKIAITGFDKKMINYINSLL